MAIVCFERAQRIDREQWNQRERKFGTQTSHFARKNMVRRDRDGDIQMVGAKVDLEKAKKTWPLLQLWPERTSGKTMPPGQGNETKRESGSSQNGTTGKYTQVSYN